MKNIDPKKFRRTILLTLANARVTRKHGKTITEKHEMKPLVNS